MSLSEPLLLPRDVGLVPVAALPASVRQRLPHQPTDFALGRAHSRALGRVIDAEAAALLEYFRAPKSIADAIFEYSGTRSLDPKSVLADSFEFLSDLFAAGLLVPNRLADAASITATLARGERIGDFEVRRPLQVLDDAEVYLVCDANGSPAALKLAASTPLQPGATLIHHEADVLRHLGGTVAPRLLEEGELRGRPFIATEWCSGVDAERAATDLRLDAAGPDLRALCCAILEAYAELHQCGVIHADVHPRNILVDRRGGVRVVDFALARSATATKGGAGSLRGGVGFFYEPELAAAYLSGSAPPPASEAGEQYALAALVYLLCSGTYYLDFSLGERALWQQIVDEPPISLEGRSAAAWPAVWCALRRALAKDPADRYPSVAQFTDAIRAASMPSPAPMEDPRASRTDRSSARRSRAGAAFVDRLIADLGLGERVLRAGVPQSPTCSIAYGAAGIALALQRMAMVRDVPELLSLAHLWSVKAIRDASQEGAFFEPALGITARAVGRRSLHHSVIGVHCVAALIASTMCDPVAFREAESAFLEQSAIDDTGAESESAEADTLLACALLTEAGAAVTGFDKHRLGARADVALQRLYETEDGAASPADAHALEPSGVAHGEAGVLHATLCWSRLSGTALPAGFLPRMDRLVAGAEDVGRGAYWPADDDGACTSPQSPRSAAWCSGTAGLVHLWATAAAIFEDRRYRALAERAGWHAWEHDDRYPDLCCGLVGRAYALLRVFRLTGDAAWLRRAQRLAAWALEGSDSLTARPLSLYKGRVGVAMLHVDLEEPTQARMPFFEWDGPE